MQNKAVSAAVLFKMSWPIFIELILQMMVGNMDQIMLSHFNSTAVAAVGNANQLITVVILLFNVIGLAAIILVCQYKGAGDESSVRKLYTLSVFLNLILSILIAVLLVVLANPLYRLLKLPAELLPEAKSYLLITALSLPFTALMLTFSSFLRAAAKMKQIMLITAVINIMNMFGNAALINGLWGLPRMGAAGAALSTVFCRAAGLAFMAWAFFKTVPGAQISARLLKVFPTGLFFRMLGIGLPSGGESFSYNLSQMSCMVFINLMGTMVVTTRAYAVIIAQVAYMMISAVSQAGQILVGYRIGARDYDGADLCARKIIKAGLPFTVGLTVVLYVFSDQIYSVFTADPAVIALGRTILLIEIFLEIGRSFNIVLVRSLQAVGDVRFPVLVGIASQWIIAVGLAWVLGIGFGFGLAGIWVAFAVDENLRGAIFLHRWFKGRWRDIKTV